MFVCMCVCVLLQEVDGELREGEDGGVDDVDDLDDYINQLDAEVNDEDLELCDDE